MSSSTKIKRPGLTPDGEYHMMIADIQKIRRFVHLLAKLGLESCRRRQPPPPAPWTYSEKYPEYVLGIDLKETKDMVERVFSYDPPFSPQDYSNKYRKI